MTTSVTNPVKTFALIALGLAIAAMGIYWAGADDKPGAAVVGFLLMFAAVLFGVRTARNRLPTWAGRTALAVGVLIAAFAAFLTHAVTVAAPLFAQPPDVPSVREPAPSPQWAAAVDRARPMVRGAIVEQNLPGVSIAAGTGGGIVWAEGFGWRDVVTQTPVTPDTRFNIGTAASAVTAAFAPLGLTNTGVETPRPLRGIEAVQRYSMDEESYVIGEFDGVAGRPESSTAASRSNDRIQVIESGKPK